VLDGGGELGYIRNNNRWKRKPTKIYIAGYETCNMHAADKIYSVRFWLEINSVSLDSCSLQLDDRPALQKNKDGIGMAKYEREYGLCAFTLDQEGIAMIDENKEKKIIRENKSNTRRLDYYRCCTRS
jgi:hypothetical protein